MTTSAAVLEIGNALSKRRARSASVALLQSISDDPKVEVIPLTEPLYERAFELYQGRPDKGWGLTDCLSFVAMQDREIIDASTADEHFRQAGFRALLHDRRHRIASGR